MIVRQIGAGGMGAVYEAIHSELQKRVVIKALLPSLSNNGDVQARFVREGQAAARIRHPNVVDIYDVGTINGTTYLVMEYLEGETLGDYLKAGPSSAPDQIAAIMLPVCAAIQAAHEVGIIHRDLKPANIFLTRSRNGGLTPKVLDFGISKIVADRLGETLTSAGEILGTPYYMSPEQAAGERSIDARSDQYSLGIILYQFATGRKPFDGQSMYKLLHRIVQGEFPPPRDTAPDMPEVLEALILRAMKRDPAERFPAVRDLGAALYAFASPRDQALWLNEFGGGTPASTPRSGGPASISSPEVRARPLAEMDAAQGLSGTLPPEPPDRVAPARKKRGALLAAVGLLGVAAGAAVLFQSGVRGTADSNPAAPAEYEVEINAIPQAASIEIDGKLLGFGHVERRFARDGVKHRLKVAHKSFDPQTSTFMDSPPPRQITLLRSTTKTTGALVINPDKLPSHAGNSPGHAGGESH